MPAIGSSGWPQSPTLPNTPANVPRQGNNHLFNAALERVEGQSTDEVLANHHRVAKLLRRLRQVPAQQASGRAEGPARQICGVEGQGVQTAWCLVLLGWTCGWNKRQGPRPHAGRSATPSLDHSTWELLAQLEGKHARDGRAERVPRDDQVGGVLQGLLEHRLDPPRVVGARQVVAKGLCAMAGSEQVWVGSKRGAFQRSMIHSAQPSVGMLLPTMLRHSLRSQHCPPNNRRHQRTRLFPLVPAGGFGVAVHVLGLWMLRIKAGQAVEHGAASPHPVDQQLLRWRERVAERRAVQGCSWTQKLAEVAMHCPRTKPDPAHAPGGCPSLPGLSAGPWRPRPRLRARTLARQAAS